MPLKKGYQKYTIRNPYAPEVAGKLPFYFKNYSNGETMYFPPYIASFQNSDTANWNAVNFLGRPEAIYTYNNSSRDGSISFFVLADYAESVMIGRNNDETQSEKIIKITSNFTKSSINNGDLDAAIQEIDNTLKNLNLKVGSSEESAETEVEKDRLNKRRESLDAARKHTVKDTTIYSESSPYSKNINDYFMNNFEYDGGYIDSKSSRQ